MSDTPDTASELTRIIAEREQRLAESFAKQIVSIEQRLTSMTRERDEAKRHLAICQDTIGYEKSRQLAADRDKARAMVSVAREAIGAIESTLGHGFFPDLTELQKLTDALAALDQIGKEGSP